jgi:oligopeptide transport system substrate-binding protein
MEGRSVGWVLCALVLGACGLPEGEYFGRVPEPDPDRMILCNLGEPEYLDPALATGVPDLKPIYALFDGLTDYDLDGFPVPSVARSWDIAPDQRTFTFHLRRDARWSDGRPLTAHDFAYSIARVLHPTTGSRNSEALWKLKNGALYTANRVRRVLRDTAGLRRGDIVEVVGLDGAVADDLTQLVVPDSNLRAARAPLALRDLGAPREQAYATVPAGVSVTLIEIAGNARDWAYVFFDEEDGFYGWVPLAELDVQPNAATRYTVRPVPPEHVPGVTLPPGPASESARPTAIVAGADLLMLPDLLGVRAADDHTLVFETWGPLPYLIELTAQRAFRATPRRAVSRWPRRWTQPEHIVTSGAYHLEAWRVRDRLELVRSRTFWDRDRVRLPRITIYSLSEATANTNLYLQGGCDALVGNNVDPAYLPFLIPSGPRAPPRYRDFDLVPYLATYFYVINTERFPNVHFRRALNFAVDRSQIPNITRGGELGSAQYTPGVPIRELAPDQLALCGVTRDTPGLAMIVKAGELCYVPPPGLDFDPARAREELAIARRELGAAFPARFTIKFNTGYEGHKLVAEWLQAEWGRILGLRVDLEAQEFKTFLKDTSGGQYDVARLGWGGNFPDPESEFLPHHRCKNPNNFSRFCNREFDALLDRAAGESDRRKRLALAAQAERILVDQAALIPLYVYTQRHLQKPYVRDLAINLVDAVSLRWAWIDPDWRRREGRR